MARTPIAAAIAALFLITASSAFAQAGGAAGTGSTGAMAPSTSPGAGRSGANANAMGSTPTGAAVPGPTSADKSAMKGNEARSATKLSHGDRKFIDEAAEGGLMEVELGRLASDKASDPAVKQFGERMVRDHSDANKKLMDLAQTKGVTPPGNVKKSDQRNIDKLSKRSGADFDRAYMDMMVKDHKKDVKEFQKEAKSKDSDVAQFASTTLPTLQEHLQLAQSTQQQVKSARRGGSSPSASSGASTGASTAAAPATGSNKAASSMGAMTPTSTKSAAGK